VLLEGYRLPVALVLALSFVDVVGCTTGGPSDGGESRPLAERNGMRENAALRPPDVPVEALKSLEKVYVPLLPESMRSLDDALAKKGYGNVMVSDFKPRFRHLDYDFGPAVVAYSAGDWVEPMSFFQPMSLTQWLEAALADSEAKGVIINPGHAGQTLALTKTEVIEAMGWLPKRDPLPTEVYMASEPR
jgi:hypothetical protein